MRFKSRRVLEGANIEFVGIFERNFRLSVKPVVEKIAGHIGRKLQRIRLRGSARHSVVSSPTLQRRMIRG